MDYQFEIQVKDLDGDQYQELGNRIAAIVRGVMKGKEDRFYIAGRVVPRTAGVGSRTDTNRAGDAQLKTERDTT